MSEAGLAEPPAASTAPAAPGADEILDQAPVAFLAGDIPPKPPTAGSRANEAVSCDLCHSIKGFEGDTPFNFNWIAEPGRVKQGNREGAVSPQHVTEKNPFLSTAEFCGTCHNEKSPFGTWVKATHLEWKEGPHARSGIVSRSSL